MEYFPVLTLSDLKTYLIFTFLLHFFPVAVLDYDDDGEEGEDEYYDDSSAGGKGEKRVNASLITFLTIIELY